MENNAFPPGSTSPRLLQTLGYARDSVGTLQRAHARYGDIFSMRVLGGENWAAYALRLGFVRSA